jgi:hypothetical protein
MTLALRRATFPVLAVLCCACPAPEDGAPEATEPAMGFTPLTLSFNATEGGANPAPATLQVANLGVGTLAKPTVASSAAWLTAAVAGDSAPFTVAATADVAGLSAASYTATLTFASPGASNDGATLAVSLTVEAATGGTIDFSTAAKYAEGIANAILDRRAECNGMAPWLVQEGRASNAEDAAKVAAAVTAGRLTYAESQARGCASALAAATCDQVLAETFGSAPCAGALLGGVAAGGSCDSDEECATSTVCGPSGCGPTCETRYANGAYCSGDDACASGFCDSSNLCAPAPTNVGLLGGPCHNYSPKCGAGLFCDAVVCATKGALSAACADSSHDQWLDPPCQAGLACASASHTCQAMAPSGASCAVLGCGEGAVCSGLVCEELPHLPGDTCDLLMFDLGFCYGGLYCDAPYPDGKCQIGTATLGAPCDSASALPADNCAPGLDCIASYCISMAMACY